MTIDIAHPWSREHVAELQHAAGKGLLGDSLVLCKEDLGMIDKLTAIFLQAVKRGSQVRAWLQGHPCIGLSFIETCDMLDLEPNETREAMIRVLTPQSELLIDEYDDAKEKYHNARG